jgi:hypothetical protein
VRALLGLPKRPWVRYLLPLYPVLVRLSLRRTIQRLLVPPAHLDAVRALERMSGQGVETGARVTV